MIISLEVKNQFYENQCRTAIHRFKKLISELNQKEIPDDLSSLINQEIQEINTYEGHKRTFKKFIENKYFLIVEILRQELGIVTKRYHISRWLPVGISIGLPIGALIFVITQQAAFIGMGVPLGIFIGLIIGFIRDEKQKEINKQLDI